MHPDPPDDDTDGAAHVSTGSLPAPERVQAVIDAAHAAFTGDRTGAVAHYIPALARVPPDLFGISVVGVNGRPFEAGDVDHPFSIQSLSKPFVFALVCQALGAEVARRRIGVAARLDSLHFRQLLGGWLLRGKDVIYLLIARIRYLRQAAAQIIDSVRA